MSLRNWIPITFKENCPACAARTRRIKTPWPYKIFRVFFPNHTTCEACRECDWDGIAFHLS